MVSAIAQLISKTSGIIQNHWVQFGKFLVVGGLNTVIGYSIFALVTLLGFGPGIALMLTYIIGVPVNYFTTGQMVFDSSSIKSFLLFIMSYISIYFVNWGLLTLLIRFGLNQLLAQAIIVPFIAILSFLVFKNFVFRNP